MTPLHQFGDFLRDALSTIPLWSVRALFVGSLIAVLLWVLHLPAPPQHPETIEPAGTKTSNPPLPSPC